MFIKDECYWNAVSFGTGKGSGSMNVVEVSGIVCCDNQERLVDVCSNDMALLREIR